MKINDITVIGAGTSALSYGVTRNASKAADKIICKGANKVVKGQQSLLSGSRYGKGAIKKGTAIVDTRGRFLCVERKRIRITASSTSGKEEVRVLKIKKGLKKAVHDRTSFQLSPFNLFIIFFYF